MDGARNAPFGEMQWTDDAPCILVRKAEVAGACWAMVEYGEGAGRDLPERQA